MKLLDRSEWVAHASPHRIRKAAQRSIRVGDAILLLVALATICAACGWLCR